MLRVEEQVLFKKHYKSLCYFAWSMVKDSDLAEDLAQDAFVAYLKHKDELSTDEISIKNFLYSSIRYAVYNLQRKNKTSDKYFLRMDFKDVDDIDYEHNIIRAEFLTAVHHAIETLPASCQEVIKLSYLEGLSNQEIADQLAISINTVKTQKQRGIKVLRSILKPEYFSVFLVLINQ